MEPVSKVFLLAAVEVTFQINAIGLLGHSRTTLATVATFNLMLSHYLMALYYLDLVPWDDIDQCCRDKYRSATIRAGRTASAMPSTSVELNIIGEKHVPGVRESTSWDKESVYSDQLKNPELSVSCEESSKSELVLPKAASAAE